MHNTVIIKKKKVCGKPLRRRIEAIQKLKPSMMIKECRSFAGMVNFLSIFCLELQGLLSLSMTLCEKICFYFREKNKRLLMKSKADYQDPQFYICHIGKGDFSYTQIQASLHQVVLCIKSRMANPSSLPLPVIECQKLPRTIL